MLPFDLDNLTFNELLGTYAAPLADKAEAVNIDPDYNQEIFLYRLVNESDTLKYVHLDFTQSFNGKVEIYNNTEVLKQAFSITDTEVIIDQTDMFSISAADFYQRYYNDLEEREDYIATDYLQTLSYQTEAKTKVLKFNVGLEPSETALVLINVIPSTHYLTVSYEESLHLEASVAAAPQLVEVGGASFKSTDITQSIEVSNDIVAATHGKVTKFKVEGTTDKVVRASISYSGATVSSSYFYNAENVADVNALLNQIIPIVGDENVKLIPINNNEVKYDSVGNPIFSLAEIDAIGDAAAQMVVTIDTPLPDTTVTVQVSTEPSSSSNPYTHNDPYAQYARPGESGSNALRRLRVLGYI